MGARLVLVSRETAVDGYKLQKTLASTAITVMQATPATWRLLLEAGWQGSNNFKIFAAGKPCRGIWQLELLKRGSSVWNMYGPTETTVWSTTSRIAAEDGPITVGRPIANTEFYVLDNHRSRSQWVSQGNCTLAETASREAICIALSLTAEKFIAQSISRAGVWSAFV